MNQVTLWPDGLLDVVKELGSEKWHQLPECAPKAVRIRTEDGEVLWERKVCTCLGSQGGPDYCPVHAA